MITVAEPIDADTLRVRHEFLNAPDRSVSVDEVVALLHVQRRHAQMILDSLVWERFLVRTCEGRYIRGAHLGS